MEQREKCNICKFRDWDDNCTKILGSLGSRTPCNYIKKCYLFKLENTKN